MPGYLMVFDRPDDDFEAGQARLEQHLRNGGSGADVPAARPEPAEPRTHEEYYEALRAADGGSSDASPNDDRPAADSSPADSSPADSSPADSSPGEEPHVADSRTDHSGWDSIDAANRPSLDALGVSPERTKHILDGDADGSGGHRHGIGNPGKTEFPASWDDEKIINALLDVARQPDHPPRHQEWNDRWVARGTRDDVEVVVVIARDERIWSGWPTPGGPAVVKNPKEL
jgi:EndoU nuclease-like protein